MRALALRHGAGLARFALAGLFSVSLILGVLWLLERAGLDARAAYAGALAASLLVNFAINRRFVFTLAAKGPVHDQALRYVLASLLFRGAEWSLFALLHGLVFLPSPLLAVGVQGVSMLVKYAVFERFVFHRR